jgi:hypothetical protein
MVLRLARRGDAFDVAVFLEEGHDLRGRQRLRHLRNQTVSDFLGEFHFDHAGGFVVGRLDEAPHTDVEVAMLRGQQQRLDPALPNDEVRPLPRREHDAHASLKRVRNLKTARDFARNGRLPVDAMIRQTLSG